MSKSFLGLVGGAFAMLACGGAPAPSVAPQPAPKPAAPPPAVVVAPPRAPSAEVRRYWSFEAEPEVQMFGALDSLMQTELFAGLVPGLLDQSDDFLSVPQRQCAQVLSASARDWLAGANAAHRLVILELGAEGFKAVKGACLGSALPNVPVAVAGADEAYALDDSVLAAKAGVVLFGPKSDVEQALAGPAKPVSAALTLKGDEKLVFQVAMPDSQVAVKGALRVSPEHFRLETEADVPNDALADMAESKLKQFREQAGVLQQNQPDVPLAKLMGALQVERKGRHFSAAFELREPVIEQARDLGVLIGLSVYGARRYVQNAKAAEARAVMTQIARNYAATLKSPPEKGARPLKKLVSLPPVPAQVPRGAKYQSAATDWNPWSVIHFGLNEPQFYQYEVVAAKDGRTAEIFARGDLNGDGKTSLFSVKVQLDPKTLDLTAIDHQERDPLE